MTTKTADSKGRVALGPQFAGQTLIVEQIDDTEVRVTIAAVVPRREMWLKRNAKARASVMGLNSLSNISGVSTIV